MDDWNKYARVSEMRVSLPPSITTDMFDIIFKNFEELDKITESEFGNILAEYEKLIFESEAEAVEVDSYEPEMVTFIQEDPS